MEIDLDLYRKTVTISEKPPVRLSVIDVWPAHATRTLVFLHGWGGQARQWVHQLRHFCEENRVIAYDMRGHAASDKPHSLCSGLRGAGGRKSRNLALRHAAKV